MHLLAAENREKGVVKLQPVLGREGIDPKKPGEDSEIPHLLVI